jgi:hypothetical protein
MDWPREVVVRRVPLSVAVELVDGIDVQGGPVGTAAELSDRPTRAPAAPDNGR